MKTSYVFFANGFEEIEALMSVDCFRRAGLPITTVSINETNEATSSHGVTVVTDTTIDEVDLSDAAWLILPGGMPGASNLAACTTLTDALLAQNAKGAGIAAICASPSIVFGPLGLLEGKVAVCYPGMEGGMKGATVGPDPVAVDGNIVTGNGPAAAPAFALTLVAKVAGEEAAQKVTDGMLWEQEHKAFYK